MDKNILKQQINLKNENEKKLEKEDGLIKQGRDDIIESERKEKIILEISREIENHEIVEVVTRYLEDKEKTDIQGLLIDPETRTRVIDQLKKISDFNRETLLFYITEGAKNVNLINRSQSEVDYLSNKAIEINSPLFSRGKFKIPSDDDYWNDESNYIKERKNGNDLRWQAWDKNNPEHLEMTNLILEEAKKYEGDVNDFMKNAISSSKIDNKSFINTSCRTKSSNSLLNKISKFRQTEWGKDASIADAVDLLGGRIVVEDLKNLEEIMTSVEEMVEKTSGAKILRKENKFIANHEKPDPYRAIQYIITLPNESGKMHTFELQLKTFSSMVSSDLFHNAVYKPDVLSLPAELQKTVFNYNWQSNYKEMSKYLDKKDNKFEPKKELTVDQEVEKAITELDYNKFYDLVLSQVDPDKPISDHLREKIKKFYEINPDRSIDDKAKLKIKEFHKKELEKLRELKEKDIELVLDLAGAAHDSYFLKVKNDMIDNPKSQQLGNKIPTVALLKLKPEALTFYLERYEKFNGKNNKISIDDLQLHKLEDNDLTEFFKLANKDVESPDSEVRKLIEKIKELRGDSQGLSIERHKIKIMNLYHSDFNELRSFGDDHSDNKIADKNTKDLWNNVLIENQIGAIATSSILTEIGGKNDDGGARDLSEVAVAGTKYTKREMLTYAFFVSAINPDSEFSSMSYKEFVTSEKSAWAKDFGKMMDRAIMLKLTTMQLSSVNSSMENEENSIFMARYYKAKIDLIQKYVKVSLTDKEMASLITKYFNESSKAKIKELLKEDPKTLNEVKNEIKDNKNIINYFREDNIENTIDLLSSGKIPKNIEINEIINFLNSQKI